MASFVGLTNGDHRDYSRESDQAPRACNQSKSAWGRRHLVPCVILRYLASTLAQLDLHVHNDADVQHPRVQASSVHSRTRGILAAPELASYREEQNIAPRARAHPCPSNHDSGLRAVPRSFRAGIIVPDWLNRIVLQTACYDTGIARVPYWTPLGYVRC